MPNFLTDHSLILSIFKTKTKVFNWRLNKGLLAKTENLELIQNEIKEFFKLNWTGEINNNIVLDYMRGVLISMGSREKKLKKKLCLIFKKKIVKRKES